MTEAEVKAQAMQYLGLLGAFTIRSNSGALKVGDRYVSFNDQPGCSDLIVCLNGRFVAIETKAPDASYRAAERRPWGEPVDPRDFPLSKARMHLEEQRSFLEAVVKAGGIGLFVRSVDELKAALEEGGII